MINRNHLKGNALVDVLGFCVVIVLIYILLISPSRSINSEKNAELQTMVTSLKGSKFEPIFKSQLDEFMVDEKLSNSEFQVLEGLFNSYQTSLISGSQDKFAESKSAELSAKNEPSENSNIMAWVFFTLFMIVVFIIGLRQVASI